MSVLIIAEIGSTHDGSFGIARHSQRAAIEAGATAVKFQTHIPDAESTRSAPAPAFFSGEPRFEYFRRTGFSASQWASLAAECRELGAEFISSPFSEEAVDLLERTGIDRYKIPSGEVTNLPLIDAVARTSKPVLLSSGMTSWAEVDRAVNTVLAHHDRLVVMQCTSEYPCPYEQVGLNVMIEMRDRYNAPVGLSDHTLTPHAAVAAVTLGASVIEKHFTLSKQLYGSDAKHSMEPHEFAAMCDGIRAAAIMRDVRVDKDAIDRFKDMRRVFQKSIVATVAIPRGTLITREMLGIKKPGTGLSPDRLNDVVGRVAGVDLAEDTVISPEAVGLPSRT
ncbi:MAG: N-acetylneuraminate synthase family protein [Acidobacteriota bacterium]|nr:N-acetylneuraminate synthase family protein [Acidobacteriota bacterium]